MRVHLNWRDRQLNQQLSWQEHVCYQYLRSHPGVNWQWASNEPDNFYHYCCSQLTVDQPCANGLVIINYPVQQTVKNFVSVVQSLITDNIEQIYMAINRYDFDPKNDLNIEYPDSLAQSIDLISKLCHAGFQRLYSPLQADGKHFVGAHGLDVYVYQRN